MADQALVAGEVDDAVVVGAARQFAGVLAGMAFDQHALDGCRPWSG
jgi:hypothetical protein